MTYRIEISPTAMTDVEGIFLWMKDYSVDRAHSVRDNLTQEQGFQEFANSISNGTETYAKAERLVAI
jgi:plasmid stabilization system protein ParE